MSSKAIVCAACNAAVPYGRLSCPACGELLASVAGAPRRVVAGAGAATATATPSVTKRGTRASRATPSVLVDVEPAVPAAAVAEAPIVEPPVAQAPVVAAPEVEAPLAHAPAPQAAPALLQPVATESATVDASPSWPEAAPSWPEERPQWRDERALAPPPAAAAVTSPSLANAPGAYVPPILPATPAGPPAPARAWAGHPAGNEAAAHAGAAASSPGVVVDPARLNEFIGWLAVAGSAMAAVGFLLPWGLSVIGASGVDYFDRWGMAGPFHPLVVLGVLAILVLALVPNPVPSWLRVGLPGLGLGALLLGLVWPYLLALPGTGPGVAVVAIGAVILIAAGIAALVADRHAGEGQAV
jgi:hypothetical protein